MESNFSQSLNKSINKKILHNVSDNSSHTCEKKQFCSITNSELSKNIFDLENQIKKLIEQLKVLKHERSLAIAENEDIVNDLSAKQTLQEIVQEGLKELKEQKQILIISIKNLERRRNKIREEMRTNFAGVSEDLAIRVQEFKKYLVGSLQDLTETAEQLKLSKKENPINTFQNTEILPQKNTLKNHFTTQKFIKQHLQIERAIKNYQTEPNYYGAPWQLRRTFEMMHAEKVKQWFFLRGGKGAINSTGNRLHDMLVASAIVSILNELYGSDNKILVLASTPERLGEWRRGLQESLGISRSDFGPDKRITLFESSEVLAQRAKKLIHDKFLPLIIIDEAEEQVNLLLLQFPLYFAFINYS